MNILLTGATGFIGQYFIKKHTQKYNIKTFSFRNNDINTLNCNDIDTVVHLSALVHQMGCVTRDEYERINVDQTITLAKKAKKSGVRHFIFMSTIKVYGEETTEIYTENSPCNPEDDYGKSKFKAENELKKLETADFKISIIRTPIVYGYGVKANMKNLVNLAKKCPVLPFNNIENKRSLVYIGNLCHLVDTIIDQKKSGIFIASDDHPISTTMLIKLIATKLNRKIVLIKIPFFEMVLKLLKTSFHKRLYGSLEVDNAVTKETLNLVNLYSTDEGIRLMVFGEN